VIYNSFGGHFSDNPRAICETLARFDGDREPVWIGSRERFPASVDVVAPYSPAYLRKLASAGHIVSNVPMPNNLIKRRGVRYLQTWHGTPLKRIGYDNDRWQLDRAGLVRATRDIARWDYLVSQNPFSTEILRRAFRFEGQVLETGYPRNDVLSAPDAEARRAQARRHLALDDDTRAVLYAPTWRDTLVDEHGRLGFSLALDPKRLRDRLGAEHVLLLRLHYAITADLSDAYGDEVVDVTAHPDIRDLYLAADVLITDYSSAMFDFAVTGKPMIFFVYDLPAYRSEIRGFYFELADEAPGPLCTTTDEVTEALSDLEGVSVASADRYTRFRERYCPHDDGRAAERVIAQAGLAH
jgi:CDP-glycerol glycerophosphotransferase